MQKVKQEQIELLHVQLPLYIKSMHAYLKHQKNFGFLFCYHLISVGTKVVEMYQSECHEFLDR